MQVIYHNLTKRRPRGEHLKGVSTLSSVLAFNHEERPCHVYSDLRQITKTIAYNGTKSGFKVKAWWHRKNLWMATCLHEHCVTHGAHRIRYVCLHMSVYLRYAYSARGSASQTQQVHTWDRTRVGTHLSKIWPYTGNWTKSRGWALFLGCSLFHETTVYVAWP